MLHIGSQSERSSNFGKDNGSIDSYVGVRFLRR